MNPNDLTNKIGLIDDDLLEEAEKATAVRPKFKWKFAVAMAACFVVVLSAALLINTFGNSISKSKVQAEDLMKNISSQNITGNETDEKFINAASVFAIDLFKETITENKNSLVSPLSVMLALAMTANGADKLTLTQMESVLSKDIPIAELNKYLFTYVNNLPDEEKSKFKISNSIWFRDDEEKFTVNKEFLQKNADYYNASAYKAPFSLQTIDDVNNWVKTHTDNMIDKIVDKSDITPLSVMFLINTVIFDAEWEEIYAKLFIANGTFTTEDNKKQNAEFMSSYEKRYIETSNATGFIKPYKNNKYSFVALLPDKGLPVKSYVASLTGKSFIELIKNSSNVKTIAKMPKFEYDYSINMASK